MTIKKMVDIEMWRKDHTSVQLSGRLLGLITPKQFALLMKSKSFRKRIATSPTMDLKVIMKLSVKEVENKRILCVAKEIEGETKVDPVLFVTEELDFIPSCNYKTDMGATGKKGTYYTFQEVS